MEIVGVEINGMRFLPYRGKDNSSGYYRSFMCFCINNYFDRIIMTPQLNHYFSLAPNDPEFGMDVFYKTIQGYNGMYFSMHRGTSEKIKIMYKIAALLRIGLFVHTLE